jgi:hypothetical protein
MNPVRYSGQIPGCRPAVRNITGDRYTWLAGSPKNVLGEDQMPIFRRGDIVRVREDALSSFKGHVGIIVFEPINASVCYMVKFESGWYIHHYLLAPEDLELIASKQEITRPLSVV